MLLSAVPTLNLTPEQSQKTVSPRNIRMEKRNLKTIVHNMLEEDAEINEVGESVPEPEPQNEEARYEILLKNYNTVLEENKKLKEQCLQSRYEVEGYKKQISQLEKKIKKISAEMDEKKVLALNHKIQEVLSGVFSKNQIDIIMNKKKNM